MRALPTAFVSLLLLALAACDGDDDDGGATPDAASFDAAASADAAPPPVDAAPPAPDAAPDLGVGKPCADDNACDPGLLCLDERAEFPSGGYCSKVCTADVDCGGGAFCSPPLGGNRVCVRACDGAGQCTYAGNICHTYLVGLIPFPTPFCMWGDTTARDGAACTGIEDCNRNSLCLSNPYNFPGGYCLSGGCTLGATTGCAPGGDGTCVDSGGGAGVCIDQCAAAADCRQAEGYTCVDLDATTKGCTYPAASIGAACASDAACGPVGSGWVCHTVGAPGGYCTVDDCTPGDASTCPLDALCHDTTPAAAGGTTCVRECASIMDCRVGYDCLPLDPVLPLGDKGCFSAT